MAGTSIGAINAAIIVSDVAENNTWEGSSERLNEFWEYLSKESPLDQSPGFTAWWDYLHNNYTLVLPPEKLQEDIIHQSNLRLQATFSLYPFGPTI